MKKFEHGRSSGGGRGGYAPARRDRAPFPSQRLNVDVSPRHYFFPFPFFSFLFVPPSSSSLLVEIPRGAHSIIRYLCRTRQERPVARKATVQETLTPFRSTSPVTLPHPPPNRCFAATHVANLAIFPPRNAIPIPKPDPSVKYLLSPSPD